MHFKFWPPQLDILEDSKARTDLQNTALNEQNHDYADSITNVWTDQHYCLSISFWTEAFVFHISISPKLLNTTTIVHFAEFIKTRNNLNVSLRSDKSHCKLLARSLDILFTYSVPTYLLISIIYLLYKCYVMH